MRSSIEKILHKKKDIHAVTELKITLSRLLQKNLVKLVLFGSKVSGEDTPHSDIDILVLIKDSARPILDQIFECTFAINLKYNVYISPRIVPLSVFNNRLWKITPFIKNLKSTGIQL